MTEMAFNTISKNLENELENLILKYLNENRYFKEEELEEKCKPIINKYLIELRLEYENDDDLKEERIDKILKKQDDIVKKNIFLLAKDVMKKNSILLESIEFDKNVIVILREKEAEFFVIISNLLKNHYSSSIIPKEALNEAKEFLNITFELDDLIAEEILTVESENMITKIKLYDREPIYNNFEVEEAIFFQVTALKLNKKIKIFNEKIISADRKIENFNGKMKNAENKIIKMEGKIEKGKIDTVSLLGIFVAIISIIYANISVSISNELSSVVITNISTVVCILFLLGFIEKSIKNENNKIPIGVIWGIPLSIFLILVIGMYSYMRYEKNNFIKYMENIYELKNKETTLELQHFTMPSDY